MAEPAQGNSAEMNHRRSYALCVAAGLLMLATVGLAQEQGAKKSDKEMFLISYTDRKSVV